MNVDPKKVAFLAIGIITAVALWFLAHSLGITTKDVSAKLISPGVTEITASENGNYAYISDKNLHILLNTGEEKVVNGFTLYGLEFSQNGSYLSASDGDSCKVISTANSEVVKQEELCVSIMWVSDSGYYFFKDNGDSSEDTSDIDGEPAYSDSSFLYFTDLTTGISSSIPEVSIDNQVSVDWNSKKMLIASYVQEASTLCSVDESNYLLIKDCVEIDGTATSIKQVDKTTYLEITKNSTTSLAKVENGNTKQLGASIRLEKSSNYKGALFTFSESSPTTTSVLSLDPSGKKAPKINISGKRFHGIKRLEKIKDNKYLVVADNGLWEIEL